MKLRLVVQNPSHHNICLFFRICLTFWCAACKCVPESSSSAYVQCIPANIYAISSPRYYHSLSYILSPIRWCPMGSVNVKLREHQHQSCVWIMLLSSTNCWPVYMAATDKCICTKQNVSLQQQVVLLVRKISYYYRWSGEDGRYCGELRGGGWIKVCGRLGGGGGRNWSKSATRGRKDSLRMMITYLVMHGSSK